MFIVRAFTKSVLRALDVAAHTGEAAAHESGHIAEATGHTAESAARSIEEIASTAARVEEETGSKAATAGVRKTKKRIQLSTHRIRYER